MYKSTIYISKRNCKYIPMAKMRPTSSNHTILNHQTISHAGYVVHKHSIIGYEPADLTVHPLPPPKQLRVGSFFFA